FTESGTGGDFERQSARVNVVVVTVRQRGFEVDHREARDHAGFLGAFETFDNTRDVFLRNGAADDLAFEFITFARFLRLKGNLDARELTRTTRLFLVGVIDLADLRDRFAVRDLRRADIGFDFEFALHAVDDDLKVKFTHTGENGLTGFMVDRNAQGRIFAAEALQRRGHLLLVGLRLRLDGKFDHRRREVHLLKDDRLFRIGQGIARARILQTDDRDDVARRGFFDFFTRVGVHQQHTADALFFIARRIDQTVARRQFARIDANEGQRAHERVVHDLERQARERLVGADLALVGLFRILIVDAFDDATIGRVRQ